MFWELLSPNDTLSGRGNKMIISITIFNLTDLESVILNKL